MTKTKITTMDKAAVSAISDAIKSIITPEALRAAGLEGVSIDLGRGRYDPAGGTFSLSLECGLMHPSGEKRTKESATFEEYARHGIDGMRPEWLFAEFDDPQQGPRGHGRVRVIGYMPRSVKWPVLVRRLSDGKQFKFPVERVVLGFKLADKSAAA